MVQFNSWLSNEFSICSSVDNVNQLNEVNKSEELILRWKHNFGQTLAHVHIIYVSSSTSTQHCESHHDTPH